MTAPADGGTDVRIRAVLAEVLDLPLESVGDDLSRDHAPQWDSLTHLRFVAALERVLDVRFTMEEVGRMSGVAEIRRILGERGRRRT